MGETSLRSPLLRNGRAIHLTLFLIVFIKRTFIKITFFGQRATVTHKTFFKAFFRKRAEYFHLFFFAFFFQHTGIHAFSTAIQSAYQGFCVMLSFKIFTSHVPPHLKNGSGFQVPSFKSFYFLALNTEL